MHRKKPGCNMATKAFWKEKRPNTILYGCLAICLAILLFPTQDVNRLSTMGMPVETPHAPQKQVQIGSHSRTAKESIDLIAKPANITIVEFAMPGIYVPVNLALDLYFPSLPDEKRWEASTPRSHITQSRMIGDPRLLIAVTTACCQQISFDRRKGVRDTWVSILKKTTQNVDVAFFVAQARNASILEEWAPLLEEEVRENNDIVVVRGVDRYRNFAEKTFGVLRYVFEHPARYTHVLKTDDDTWVQPSVALRLIHHERLKFPGSFSLYAGCFANFQRNWFRELPNTSKWFMPEYELPESALPEHPRYAHGYGYILSADLIEHVVFESQEYFRNRSSMPVWFRDLRISPLEDFMIGLLVRDVARETSKCDMFQESCYDEDAVHEPSNCEMFQDACYAGLAVRHLQEDSPQNLHNYAIWHEHEMNGTGMSRNTHIIWRPVCAN